jgi:hypothetical protein
MSSPRQSLAATESRSRAPSRIVTSADAGPASGVSADIDAGSPELRPYEPPVLERYADMEDLLALDPPMPGIANLPWQGADESGSSP